MTIEPLQVLIVDDSRIFRGVLESALASRPDVRVVGSVWSGEKAIEFVRKTPPDLVTLDVNMPGCGGLEALSSIQQINAERPDRSPVGVILVSAITKKGAAVTVEGLQRGAFDFIPKPEGPSEDENAATIKRQLFEKIDLFLDKRSRRFQPSTLAIPRVGPIVSGGTSRYQAIVIGSSTGGPEALTRILPTLCTKTSVPIFIVQHFPAGMTKYFAVGLSKICSHAVTEATDGGIVQERTIYIAPGGRHLLVRRQQQQVITMLNDQPPENHCRPSVDVLFRSAAVAYDGNVIAVILTGMGNDGAAGLGALKRSKAHIIAQDQATSLVWGMPGAAVATNYVDEILPLDQIAAAIGTRMGAR